MAPLPHASDRAPQIAEQISARGAAPARRGEIPGGPPGPADRPGSHAHLWKGSDGTGLHAPPGSLTSDPDTGRLCCHLCGRWYTALGSHLRVHGLTATAYRELVGLCRGRALTAADLSTAISVRQKSAYDDNPLVRRRLAPGQDLARTGELGELAKRALRTGPEPPERTTGRREQLAAGRATRAATRNRRLQECLQAAGAPDLGAYLRGEYTRGASLATLATATGLGRTRLRGALTDAGVTVREPGATTPTGRRSRAHTAETRAEQRLGVTDLPAWLRERHTEGWSLQHLAATVGHSSHWVRRRIQDTPDPTLPNGSSRTNRDGLP